MINEKELEYLCNKYRIKYQLFHTTNIILLNTGFDIWQVKYIDGKIKPYLLLHKNIRGRIEKFHVHGWRRNLFQTIDSVASHKKVLVNLFGSSNTYKQNKNIKKYRRKKFHC